jgi:hypothetical protein
VLVLLHQPAGGLVEEEDANEQDETRHVLESKGEAP